MLHGLEHPAPHLPVFQCQQFVNGMLQRRVFCSDGHDKAHDFILHKPVRMRIKPSLRILLTSLKRPEC